MSGWTERQHAVFRSVLGVYLCAHFVFLLPWTTEVFSNEGVLPDGAASPLFHAFPNVLSLADSPLAARVLVGGAALLSALLAVGWHDRIVAVGIWYASACLYGRNPLTSSPHLPYIGWILLGHAATPGKGLPSLHRVAWVVLAVAYGYSGYTKLASPSWLDGSAVARILECPLARPGLARDVMRGAPASALAAATWGALALEIGFAPLALWRRARPWLWSAMLLMHVSLLVLLAFPDLSAGMILVHFFTFDPAWIHQEAPRASALKGVPDRESHAGSPGSEPPKPPGLHPGAAAFMTFSAT